MPTITVRQSFFNYDTASPFSCTLGQTPLEGNLLIAIVAERSGAEDLSVLEQGWNKIVGVNHLPLDTTWRKTHAVWYKIAGASESTTIDITQSGTSAAMVVGLAEFNLSGAPVSFADAVAVPWDNATVTSISSGNTTSIATSDNLIVAVAYCKQGGTSANYFAWSDWTAGLDTPTEFAVIQQGSNLNDVSWAFGQTTHSGVHEVTAASPTGLPSERGGIISLAVFSVGAVSGDATVSPSTVLASAAIGSPLTVAGADLVVLPATVTGAATIGVSTVLTGSLVSVSPVTVAGTVTVSGTAETITSVTPATISTTAAIATGDLTSTSEWSLPISVTTIGNPVTVSPTVIQASAIIGATQTQAGSLVAVSPATVAVTAAVPIVSAVTAGTGAGITSTGNISVSAFIPDPTILAGQETVVTPTTLSRTATIAGPIITAPVSAQVLASMVAATVTVGAPTVVASTGNSVIATRVDGTVVIAQPTIMAGSPPPVVGTFVGWGIPI